MADCGWCEQEMTARVGCTEEQYEIMGEIYDRIPAADDCHDCAAPAGTLHHPGCDSETCPRCLGQSISCHCE